MDGVKPSQAKRKLDFLREGAVRSGAITWWAPLAADPPDAIDAEFTCQEVPLEEHTVLVRVPRLVGAFVAAINGASAAAPSVAEEVRRQLAARGVDLRSVVAVSVEPEMESRSLLFAVTYRA